MFFFLPIFPYSSLILFYHCSAALLRVSEKSMEEVISFDPETFFIYVLPPIIFDSGYSMHKVYICKKVNRETMF